MSQSGIPAFVGNDFIAPQRRIIPTAKPRPTFTPNAVQPAMATTAIEVVSEPSIYMPEVAVHQAAKPWQRALNMLHTQSIIAFSLLVLLVGSTGTTVYGNYLSAAIDQQARPALARVVKPPSIAGLNASVPLDQLDAKIQAVISQSAALTVGDDTKPVSPDTIKSWLRVSKGTAGSIHVDSAAITKSLTELAQKYEKAPVNEVTSTSGGAPAVIATGKNGAKLSDPASIAIQVKEIAKTLLDAKGFAVTTPLETVPFKSVTPAAFEKMIEINIVSKQMYLYQNGQLVKSYQISAGAPATPTPVGQFKIFSKLSVQDMRGFNADGTKYFQPHVRWVSYFMSGGYAIHGNYWRPASWFGNINSSHGCASLPDAQAKEVYDFAPIGTTVITHR